MGKRKTALITGITGQDGSYLFDLLIRKNYEVHGLVRYDAQNDTTGLSDAVLHDGDLTDANSVNHILKTVRPDEIYNLAALSHVKVSFQAPASAFTINTLGTLNILEGVRVLGLEKTSRIFQASSSEMFGSAPAPQNEAAPMTPQSPYAVAKLASYHLAQLYRHAYGLFVSNGIAFNHESPTRGEHFVTRKITLAVAQIEQGRAEPVMLGNLNSVRDWGYAGDYVEAMWRMLQQPAADDFVLATGQSHSVRQFTERAFAQIGVNIEWRGEGLAEQGIDAKTGRILVAVDPALFRPQDVECLIGDASKAQKILDWRPQVRFDELVSRMVNADRQSLNNAGGRAWRKTG